MLFFFRGELTEPFLLWLREPPMAATESVFVSVFIPDASCVLFTS